MLDLALEIQTGIKRLDDSLIKLHNFAIMGRAQIPWRAVTDCPHVHQGFELFPGENHLVNN